MNSEQEQELSVCVCVQMVQSMCTVWVMGESLVDLEVDNMPSLFCSHVSTAGPRGAELLLAVLLKM